ncbi:putative secreted protein [Rhodopirellula maiorica SM1]|uniref:Putative secreted protein n=2 Tax=Novipirellula TaxID=2795426 RepID=M5RMB7_9BACT|nr:putative secreted protein [Rhodopirellula maiorica SM1]
MLRALPFPWFITAIMSLSVVGNAFGVQPDAKTETRRIDGYKGIWFTLGQFYGKGSGDRPYAKVSREPVFPYGDKYSGGLGTYTAKHTPLAIYCPEVEKTFFVYGGTTGPDERHLLCMISYFDHKTNQVPRPVVVHNKQGVDDPHDNPSLAIDSDGYVWVFVSGRGRSRPGFKYRSTQPYSIDHFTQISEEEMTYPQPHVIADNGMLHLFTKYTGVRELYWERSKDGVDWTADQKLAGIREPGDSNGGHYQSSAIRGDKVGTFFNRHPNGNVDRRTDLYYVQTCDMGTSWTTVDGTVLETPLVDVNCPARVVDYASQGLNVYLKDMKFDHSGHPVLLYVTSPGAEPGPPNDPRHFRITRWDGADWKTSTIGPTDHNYDMGSLDLGNQNDPVWTVRIPSASGPQPWHGGGEVVLWESRNQGGSWVKKRQVTSNSPKNHNYIRQPLKAKDPFFVFWADGDPTRMSTSQLYFADRSGQNVWRLPYQMTDDFAEPELVASPSSADADEKQPK